MSLKNLVAFAEQIFCYVFQHIQPQNIAIPACMGEETITPFSDAIGKAAMYGCLLCIKSNRQELMEFSNYIKWQSKSFDRMEVLGKKFIKGKTGEKVFEALNMLTGLLLTVHAFYYNKTEFKLMELGPLWWAEIFNSHFLKKFNKFGGWSKYQSYCKEQAKKYDEMGLTIDFRCDDSLEISTDSHTISKIMFLYDVGLLPKNALQNYEEANLIKSRLRKSCRSSEKYNKTEENKSVEISRKRETLSKGKRVTNSEESRKLEISKKVKGKGCVKISSGVKANNREKEQENLNNSNGWEICNVENGSKKSSLKMKIRRKSRRTRSTKISCEETSSVKGRENESSQSSSLDICIVGKGNDSKKNPDELRIARNLNFAGNAKNSNDGKSYEKGNSSKGPKIPFYEICNLAKENENNSLVTKLCRKSMVTEGIKSSFKGEFGKKGKTSEIEKLSSHEICNVVEGNEIKKSPSEIQMASNSKAIGNAKSSSDGKSHEKGISCKSTKIPFYEICNFAKGNENNSLVTKLGHKSIVTGGIKSSFKEEFCKKGKTSEIEKLSSHEICSVVEGNKIKKSPYVIQIASNSKVIGTAKSSSDGKSHEKGISSKSAKIPFYEICNLAKENKNNSLVTKLCQTSMVTEGIKSSFKEEFGKKVKTSEIEKLSSHEICNVVEGSKIKKSLSEIQIASNSKAIGNAKSSCEGKIHRNENMNGGISSYENNERVKVSEITVSSCKQQIDIISVVTVATRNAPEDKANSRKAVIRVPQKSVLRKENPPYLVHLKKA